MNDSEEEFEKEFWVPKIVDRFSFEHWWNSQIPDSEKAKRLREWKKLPEDERPKFQNGLKDTRKVLRDHYGWSEEKIEEEIFELKRFLKLQAFK